MSDNIKEEDNAITPKDLGREGEAERSQPVEATGLLNVAVPRSPEADAAAREPFFKSITTADERQRGLIVLFVSLIAVGMGQSLVFTILPPLARDLGLQEWMVSSIFATSAFCWVFSSPFWGRRSDRWGRKPAILIGTAGYTVSMFCFALAIKTAQLGLVSLGAAFILMVATRSIFGLFGSSTNPAANAYVADRTTPAERAVGMGLLGAAFGVGGVLGPGVAGALSAIDLLAPIYFVAFLGLLSGLLVYVYLPERTRPTERLDRPKMKMSDRRVLPFLIFGVALSLVQGVTVQTIAFYFMDKLGMAAKEVAQFVAVGFMGSALAALFAQLVIVQRFGLSTRALMRGGIGLGAVTYLMFVLAPAYGPLTFAMVLQGLAFGLARPGFSAAASLAVKPDEQGMVAGLLGSTGAAGHIASPLVVLVFYQGMGPASPYLLCLGLMSILFASLYLVPAFRVIRERQ